MQNPREAAQITQEAQIQIQPMQHQLDNNLASKDNMRPQVSNIHMEHGNEKSQFPNQQKQQLKNERIKPQELKISSQIEGEKKIEKGSYILGDQQKELLSILNKYQIEQEEETKLCKQLWDNNKIDELKKIPSGCYADQFSDQIDNLLAKRTQNKQQPKKVQNTVNFENQLKEILREVQIVDQKSIFKCLQLFKSKNFETLKKFPKKTHKVKFALLLDQFLLKIQNIKREIQKISPKQCEYKINVKYKKETVGQILNEMILESQPDSLQKIICSASGKQLGKLVVFQGQQVIKVSQFKFQSNKQYSFQVFEKKIFSCKYGQNTYQVQLLPGKMLKYNKKIISQELIKAQAICLQDQKFSIYNLKISFGPQIQRARRFEFQAQTDYDAMTIYQIQEMIGRISNILVQIKLQITIYYKDRPQKFNFWSSSKVIELRKAINNKMVPFESQILQYSINEQQMEELQEYKDQYYLTQLSNKCCLTFSLKQKLNLQFYGFNQNILLTFQMFSQFSIGQSQYLKTFLQSYQFVQDQQEELKFAKVFFESLFSAIKRNFLIKTVIDKFKDMVSKIKFENLWSNRVSQTFVFTYMLANSDCRLKIQLMSLIRPNLPIPLYLKEFDSVSKVNFQFLINQQVLWILKEGYVLTSIGLNSQNNAQLGKANSQHGKSSLLNKLFLTQFQQFQNKHQIFRNLPFVALRVFEDHYPIHVIDIPQDCPKYIKEQILKISDLVLLHSWLPLPETQKHLNNIKNIYNVPAIALLRDCQGINFMKALKQSPIKKEKIQKIINLNKAQTTEVGILRKQIYEFISLKLQLHKHPLPNRIINLFETSKLFPLYRQFNQVVQPLKEKMLDLSCITQVMAKIKKHQIVSKIKDLMVQQKETIEAKLSPELLRIIKFLMGKELHPQLGILLRFFREKLKAFNNQWKNNYKKIHLFKNTFEQIKSVKDIETKKNKIQKLNEEVSKLDKLCPPDINYKDEQQISQIFVDLVNQYEDDVKTKLFSIDIFWREFNYLAKINEQQIIQGRPMADIVRDFKRIQIKNNLPFEIIDGDLLEMPSETLKKLCQNNYQKATIVTILGPQSSGKSTLLNFMFGCGFATSQGRCTRGVYGTFFRFSENKGLFSNLTSCDGIFVLDTEGLFSANNDNEKINFDRDNFDQKIVLFCLGVSDFVIINTKKNIDANTAKIIRLCDQRLIDLNISQERRPEIIIVFNQNETERVDQYYKEQKQIKKTINFKLSKSLTNAYNVKNYRQNQIFLIGMNETLTKKYPLQSFYYQTDILTNQILKDILEKKKKLRVSQILQKMIKVWAIIINFPNLSIPKSNSYRQLEKKITLWKNQLEDESQKICLAWIQNFKNNQSTYLKIQEQIQRRQQILYRLYEDQFQEKLTDEEAIKKLKAQEKAKISYNILMIKENIKYQIQNIKLSNQMSQQFQKGNNKLKQLAKNIVMSRRKMTQQQKKIQFDKCFDQQLNRIQQKISTKGLNNYLFTNIYKNYQIQLRLRNKEVGLPRAQAYEDLEQMQIQQYVELVKRKIIQPKIEALDIVAYTNKIHTNTLIGGKTDASLQYFNVKNYFQEEEITKVYCIPNKELQLCLNTENITKEYHSISKKVKEKQFKNQKLKRIFQEINTQLEKVGLKFTNFSNFQKIFQIAVQIQQSRIKFFGKKNLDNQKIQYSFLSVRPLKIDSKIYCRKLKSHDCNNCSALEIQKFHKTQLNAHNHGLGPYTKQEIQIPEKQGPKRRCICTYTKTSPPKENLQQILVKHVDWKEIQSVIQPKQIQNYIQRDLTQAINQDIEKCNLQIKSAFWKQKLFPQKNSIKANPSYHLTFTAGWEPIKIERLDQIAQIIEGCCYLKHKQIRQRFKIQELKRNQITQNFNNDQRFSDLNTLFLVQTTKFKPINKNQYFETYIIQENQTIKEFKKKQFKKFIISELNSSKNNTSILDTFYRNIYKIVQKILDKWQSISGKCYLQIYSKVSDQITKFNNDLNQISYNLSPVYIGYINLYVVYIIWKIAITKKKEKNKQIYKNTSQKRQQEWKMFIYRTSDDKDDNIQAQIRQFLDEFNQHCQKVISSKKKQLQNQFKSKFQNSRNRKKLQKQIEEQIFLPQASEQLMIEHLDFPYKKVQQKYQMKYEKSWMELQSTFQTNQIVQNLIIQFKQCLKQLVDSFQKNQLDESKNLVADLFEQLIDEKGQEKRKSFSQISSKSKILPEQQKQLYAQYFIDLLISEDKKKQRHYSCYVLKAIKSLGIKIKITNQLKVFLIDVKTKGFQITNLVKFTKRLLAEDIFQNLKARKNSLFQLTQQDKSKYLDKIKIIVCKQMCPCCGRLCDQEDGHSVHRCLYGHQVRGLNGTYVIQQYGSKQASLITCQQISEFDWVKYNQRQYDWVEFKKQWKDKWNFQFKEFRQEERQQKKQQLQKIWKYGGKAYCKKHKLKHLQLNQFDHQKKEIPNPVHHIFALDQSGSMQQKTPLKGFWNKLFFRKDKRWNCLLNSMKQTIKLMQELDNKRNLYKVSIIKFNSKATIVQDYKNPSQIKLEIAHCGGSTNFQAAFINAAIQAEKYIRKSKTIFIFMTDGIAEYPKEGVARLKNLQEKYPNKMHYAGILFNPEENRIMRDIARQLKGSTNTVFTPEELTQKFKRSVEVLKSENRAQ